jgi:hypothetical protein
MQAAADVDDLPTYEPAPDTTHQDGLVTIQGRYATLTGIRAGAAGEISYSEGEKFDSICFGRRPDCSSLHNTVLLVPGLLSPAECEKLGTWPEISQQAADGRLTAPCGQRQ